MMTGKRLIAAVLAGTMLFAWARQTQGQITVSELRTLKQKYVNEYLKCSDMTATVNAHLNTPVGKGWTGYDPTEWDIAADLTRAAGCGNRAGETRLRQAIDYAEKQSIANWWDIEIGVPRALADALMVGANSIPSDLRARLDAALSNFIRQQKVDEANGANVTMWAWTKLRAALYLEDEALAQSAHNLFITATSQGDYSHIVNDWSYIFHWDVMNMHYGAGHYYDFAQYLSFTDGSSLSLAGRDNPNDAYGRTGLEIYLEWFDNYVRWIYYKGHMDPFTASKFPYQQDSYSGRIDRGTELMTRASYSEVPSYRPAMQELLSSSNNPVGARSFPVPRYLVVRRDRFYASLSMVNLVEPHMEASPLAPIFGAVNILDPSSMDKWESDNIRNYPYQLLNAMTLPAAYENATVEPRSEHSGREHLDEITAMLRNWGYYGVSTLAGFYGMGAERLTGENNEFTMRRSWFFFDDEIVCLGSGLSANSSLGGMRTLLYTFPAQGGSFQSSNGSKTIPTASNSEQSLGQLSWLQHHNMGYHFPNTPEVRAQGLGSDRGRVYLNHGNAPSNASFAAVLLPTFSASATQNYAANPDVEIIRLDPQAHIIKERSSNVTGIAAFEPIDTGALAINFAGYVLYQNSNGRFGLSLTNPHREEQKTLNTVADRVNPMLDHDIKPEQASSRNYKLQVPFTLRKGSGKGMELFQVANLSPNESELEVNLRVYRKFEIEGTANNDGSITINSAWIALNDAAQEENNPPLPTQRPPVALTSGDFAGRVGETLNLSGAGSYDPDGGSIVSYQWNFGDGANASGAQVSHQYANPGSYQASLEVTDDEGEKNIAGFQVSVQPASGSGENLRVVVSGDDSYEIYVNGTRLGNNASWQTSETYSAPLLSGKNVVAVKAVNWDNAGGFIAEVYEGANFWPSGTAWKVSTTEINNWQEIEFDDGQWSAATSHGLHGVAQPWAQYQNVSGISTGKNVQWIWSADKLSDHVVYFRLVITPGSDQEAPGAPTGIRISTQ